MKVKHDSMRGHFSAAMHNLMGENQNVFLITGDVGYGFLDDIARDYPGRYLNTGASEQAMLGIGVGLALSGKVPFCYSMTSFLLCRPYEWIRNYLDHESIPVKLVGVGRDRDYADGGISHHAEDARHIMSGFKNITQHWPETNHTMPALLSEIVNNGLPTFLSLKK